MTGLSKHHQKPDEEETNAVTCRLKRQCLHSGSRLFILMMNTTNSSRMEDFKLVTFRSCHTELSVTV
jgi:hypothetical protein